MQKPRVNVCENDAAHSFADIPPKQIFSGVLRQPYKVNVLQSVPVNNEDQQIVKN